MLEIKTITKPTVAAFDKAVNSALQEGWEILRRECFITGSDRATTFYAELERTIEVEEEEYTDIYESAQWEITRDPHHPFRCSACGFKAITPTSTCVSCGSPMRGADE